MLHHALQCSSTHFKLFVPVQAQLPVLAPLFSAFDAPWLTTVATWVLRFMPCLYAFIAIPVLDMVLGEEGEAGMPITQRAWYTPLYRAICQGYTALHLGVTMTAVAVSVHAPLAVVLCNALNVSMCGAFAFVVAHEMVHSQHKLDRTLADVLLTSLCYKHWSLSHQAHHLQVATHCDPASARFKESVRSFFLSNAMCLQLHIVHVYKTADRRARNHIV